MEKLHSIGTKKDRANEYIRSMTEEPDTHKKTIGKTPEADLGDF